VQSWFASGTETASLLVYAAQWFSSSEPAISVACNSNVRSSSCARTGLSGAPSDSVRRSWASQCAGFRTVNFNLARVLVRRSDSVSAATNSRVFGVATSSQVSVPLSRKLIFNSLFMTLPSFTRGVTGAGRQSNSSVNSTHSARTRRYPLTRLRGQGRGPAQGAVPCLRRNNTRVASLPAASFDTHRSPFGRNASPSGWRKTEASNIAYPVILPRSSLEIIT